MFKIKCTKTLTEPFSHRMSSKNCKDASEIRGGVRSELEFAESEPKCCSRVFAVFVDKRDSRYRLTVTVCGYM